MKTQSGSPVRASVGAAPVHTTVSSPSSLLQRAQSFTVAPIAAVGRSMVGTASSLFKTPQDDSSDAEAQSTMAALRDASPRPGETFQNWRMRSETATTGMRSIASAPAAMHVEELLPRQKLKKLDSPSSLTAVGKCLVRLEVYSSRLKLHLRGLMYL